MSNSIGLVFARHPAIAPAALFSLLVHIAVAMALGVLVSTRPAAWGNPVLPLQVELQTSPTAFLPSSVPLPPAPELLSPEVRSTVPPVPVPDPPALAQVPPDQTPLPQKADALQASAPPTLPSGHVRIAAAYAALSSLPEELVQRSQGEYLVEVDKLVQVIKSPDIVYPADALASGRGGEVLVWIALDREGTMIESIIVTGDPEFADAVTRALPSARFLPAVNAGEAVPFYIIMTFSFQGG